MKILLSAFVALAVLASFVAPAVALDFDAGAFWAQQDRDRH
jgi:hypothetical protein